MTKPIRRNFRFAALALGCCLAASAQAQYLAIDLGPTTRANAVVAGQQAGYTCCGPNIVRHALLWSGRRRPCRISTPLPRPQALNPASMPWHRECKVDSLRTRPPSGTVPPRAISTSTRRPIPPPLSSAWATGNSSASPASSTRRSPIAPSTTRCFWTTASSGSVIDLHPGGGWRSSFAYGAAGGKQVGAVANSSSEHAVIWSGSAKSYVDLHTSKFISTIAYGIYGGQQVGHGYMKVTAANGATLFINHALLWAGSASRMTDLHPAGLSHSFARGMNTTKQVGFGYIGTVAHALVGSGTAATALDLHQFVAGFPESDAFAIDINGNIAGIAGDSITDVWHAIVWIPLN